MTTPSQPGDDLNVEPEVIEDLDVTDDDADNIAGGCIHAGVRAQFSMPLLAGFPKNVGLAVTGPATCKNGKEDPRRGT